MRIIVLILLLSISRLAFAQEAVLVDYQADCLEGLYIEDVNQIKNQVFAYNLFDSLLTIELSVTLNCGDADTAYIKFRNDSLFIETEYSKEITENEDGTKSIVYEEAECDCAFNLALDIYGIQKIPDYIAINNNSIEINNWKYRKGYTEELNGEQVIKVDDCGYTYHYLVSDKYGIIRIDRIKGIKKQMLIYEEGHLYQITTFKGLDSLKSILIEK